MFGSFSGKNCVSGVLRFSFACGLKKLSRRTEQSHKTVAAHMIS